jgi:hypothetical protein
MRLRIAPPWLLTVEDRAAQFVGGAVTPAESLEPVRRFVYRVLGQTAGN